MITIGIAKRSSARSVFCINKAIMNPAPTPSSTPINKNLFVFVGTAASNGKAGISPIRWTAGLIKVPEPIAKPGPNK